MSLYDVGNCPEISEDNRRENLDIFLDIALQRAVLILAFLMG